MNDPDDFVISRRPSTDGGAMEVTLRSSALVFDGDRIPIPADGLSIGFGYGVDLSIGGLDREECIARVEPTAEGHVVVVELEGADVMLNGEPIVVGERRPLGRADTLSLQGRLAHFVPAGAAPSALPQISAVDAGRVRVQKDVVSIGRAPSNDIHLDHPTVALNHARLIRKGTEANIEDTSGGLGILVNGRRTDRARLATGDVIAVGPFRIVYDGTELIDRGVAGGLPVAAFGVRVDVASGTILHPTDLTLHPGELTAIIGESGAGKTTLLRALSGVSTPTSGRVLVGGEDVQLRLPDVGYVPQFDTVQRQLTVREVLDFAARLRLPSDTPTRERTALIDEVIDQLGLAERAELPTGRLSGGQRKRVAVGIEMLHKPGAIFLDEPTTGLDPALEHRMMQLFRLLADNGQTVTLVTHATASIALCDRVVVMGRGGHLLFDGPPDEMQQAFGVESFDDVYVALDQGVRPASAASQTSRAASNPSSAQPPRREVQHTWWFQAKVLAHRYALITLRDPRHIRSAFLQIPVLALFSAFLMPSSVFAHATEESANGANPKKAATLIFIMVIISVWLGSVNSAREIVKEEEAASREFSIGVKVVAYFASKLVVLLAISTAQTALLTVLVLGVRAPHESAAAVLNLFFILTIGGWLAVILGLVVSALSSSEDQAIGVIPLLLVPQMLFAGSIVPYPDMPSALKFVAAFIPTRWSFAAGGHAFDMNGRLAELPAGGSGNPYGDFFDLTTGGFVAVAVIFAAVLSFAVCVVLERKNRARVS